MPRPAPPEGHARPPSRRLLRDTPLPSGRAARDEAHHPPCMSPGIGKQKITHRVENAERNGKRSWLARMGQPRPHGIVWTAHTDGGRSILATADGRCEGYHEGSEGHSAA